MLSQDDLNNVDSKKMFKIYDKWPEITEEAYNTKQNSFDADNIDNIIFAGMGGSGTLGDIFYSILSKTEMHVSIVKGYHLPKTINENSLVVATSVSGNTTETLTVLEEAKKTKAHVVAFSSGGIMKSFSDKNKIEHVEIQSYHSPRVSFTSYLYGMLNFLKPILPIHEKDLKESIKQLYILRDNISSSNLTDSNKSLKFAQWIKGVPVIYYPWGLQAAATRFKNSLQENSKMHVIAEDIVEACHNGIVAWEKPSNANPIIIQGKDDFVKTKELWNIIEEFFESKNIDFQKITTVEGNIITKLIDLIYFFDYTSLYSAVLSKVDPSPVDSINFVKSKINSNLL